MIMDGEGYLKGGVEKTAKKGIAVEGGNGLK